MPSFFFCLFESRTAGLNVSPCLQLWAFSISLSHSHALSLSLVYTYEAWVSIASKQLSSSSRTGAHCQATASDCARGLVHWDPGVQGCLSLRPRNISSPLIWSPLSGQEEESSLGHMLCLMGQQCPVQAWCWQGTCLKEPSPDHVSRASQELQVYPSVP